jgi:site-specific DNA-methyltransferase (adenine-specific)
MPQTFKTHHGDAMDMLRAIPTGSVQAVITDPPYSSGGFSRDDKGADTAKKYQHHGVERAYPDFGGDSRDQRSYLAWVALWMTECYRVLEPGGYMLAFTDWRQLPVMTDAVQVAGVFWRGLIAWDKGLGARAPHKGYFKHQCEYVVWGTKGKAKMLTHAGPFPGCFKVPVKQADKHHTTGKPTDLMRELVRVVPAGGLVADPFMGSGTTGVAALLEGLSFIGAEREQAYVDIATRRMQEALQQHANA